MHAVLILEGFYSGVCEIQHSAPIPREKAIWIYVPIEGGCGFDYDGCVALAKMKLQQKAKALGNSGAKADGNINCSDLWSGQIRNGCNRYRLAVRVLKR